MSRTHTLYRMFDAEGHLLYVGLTNNPTTRLKGHGSSKLWWSKVCNVTVEHFGSRAELKAAEKAAIRAEAPIYNVSNNAAQAERRIDFEFEDEEDFEDECMGQALKRLEADVANGAPPEEMVRKYAQYVNEAKGRYR